MHAFFVTCVWCFYALCSLFSTTAAPTPALAQDKAPTGAAAGQEVEMRGVTLRDEDAVVNPMQRISNMRPSQHLPDSDDEEG